MTHTHHSTGGSVTPTSLLCSPKARVLFLLPGCPFEGGRHKVLVVHVLMPFITRQEVASNTIYLFPSPVPASTASAPHRRRCGVVTVERVVGGHLQGKALFLGRLVVLVGRVPAA